MSQPPAGSLKDRSTFLRWGRWLFSWRILRRLFLGVAWIVTLIALLYGEENWRGRRAWTHYREGMEAKGVQFDSQAFFPKPIPDAQNFAATPFFEHLFARKGNGPDWPDDFSPAFSILRSLNKGREFTDLVAWETAFAMLRSNHTARPPKLSSGKLDTPSRAQAAPQVLAALKSDEDLFDELVEAGRRPASRYPVKYSLDDPWGVLLPHLAPIKGLAQRLRLRACARLAAGQVDNALADIHLILRLADSLRDEPIVISYLVRVACVQLAAQPAWEGLTEHRWSENALQQLQERFQKYDFLADLKLPTNAERAAGALTADLLYRKKYRLSNLVDTSDSSLYGDPLANLLAGLAPHGWYYQEQLNYCRIFEEQVGSVFDPGRKRVYPREIEQRSLELQKMVPGALLHHRMLAVLLLPALNRVVLKAAVAQTVTDQAALACALERFRLAQGEFPEKLETLVPRYCPTLPRDVLSGESYKYRRTDPTHFILYSVGWDEQDNGGARGPIAFDEKQGDWLWE